MDDVLIFLEEGIEIGFVGVAIDRRGAGELAGIFHVIVDLAGGDVPVLLFFLPQDDREGDDMNVELFAEGKGQVEGGFLG